ncbi:hypothetical protein [Streptomyces gobitricini]
MGTAVYALGGDHDHRRPADGTCCEWVVGWQWVGVSGIVMRMFW